MSVNKNIQSWVAYANEYYSMAKFSQNLIHIGLALPGIDAGVVVQTSKTILDVGCGNGLNTKLMSKVNTACTVGIDPVQSQIDFATIQYSSNNLNFFCSDFHGVSTIQPAIFDLVTFFGSIDYIPLDTDFFHEINALTRSGSRCYISKFHPMWTTLFANDVDEENSKESYFDIGRIDFVKFGKNEFNRYHYGIGEMFTLFNNGGWNLLTLSEPKPDFTNSSFKYKSYECDPLLKQRIARIPMTMTLEFTKR